MNSTKIEKFFRWLIGCIISVLVMFLILVVFNEQFTNMAIKMRIFMGTKSSLKIDYFYNVCGKPIPPQMEVSNFRGKKRDSVSFFSLNIKSVHKSDFIQILPDPEIRATNIGKKGMRSFMEKYMTESNFKTVPMDINGEFYKISPRRGIGHVYLSPEKDGQIDIICVYVYI